MKTIQFCKTIGKSIQEGIITVPKEFDHVIDKYIKCPVGISIDIEYRIADKYIFKGRIYQSINNTTNYYQFYIISSSDKKIFKSFRDNYKKIYIKFFVEEKILTISK